MTSSLMPAKNESEKGWTISLPMTSADPDTTFGSDQNAVHLIGEDEAHYLPLATKQVIAERIVSLVAHHLEATNPTSG